MLNLFQIILTVCGALFSKILLIVFSKTTRFKGKDFHKKDMKEIPEGMGISSALAFIVILFTYFMFIDKENDKESRICLNILFITILSTALGVLDDIFELNWFCKIIVPIIISSIYIYLLYEFDTLIRQYFTIWKFYYIVKYALFGTFCPNSINILSGINGIEVIQILIITIGILVDNLLCFYKLEKYKTIYKSMDLKIMVPKNLFRYLYQNFETNKNMSIDICTINNITKCLQRLYRIRNSDSYRHFINQNNSEYILQQKNCALSKETYDFCIFITFLHLFVAIPLYLKNRYPSSVFIGDVYCFFAGSIIFSLSKMCSNLNTVLFFMLPQIANFVISLPQLLGVVECPRHRFPSYKNGKLYPSYFYSYKLKCKQMNYTILNTILYFKSYSEKILVLKLTLFYIFWCSLILFIKYFILQ